MLPLLAILLPALIALAIRLRWPGAGVTTVLASPLTGMLALLALAASVAPLAIWPPEGSAEQQLAEGFTPYAAMAVAASLGASLAAAKGGLPVWILHLGLLTTLAAAAGSTAARHAAVVRVDLDPRPQLVTVAGITLAPLIANNLRIEHWPPRLIRVHADGRIIPGSELGPDAQDGELSVLMWLPSCAVVDGQPWAYVGPGTRPAALIGRGSATLGWLHPGSLQGPALTIATDDGHLAMEVPRVRRYSVTLDDQEVTVNHPLRKDGWWLHLSGYEERLGADSPWVALAIDRDEVLPLVWIGLALVGLGCLLRIVQVLRP